MPEHVLEVQNIVKDFAGVRALKGVSFFADSGEIVGLIGENGAGKSTLLKIINGVYKHGSYEGKVLIDGDEIEINSSQDAIQKGIGYVPQEISIMEDLTIAENIFVGHLNDSESTAFSFRTIYEKARSFLEGYKIELDPAMKARALSIAQRQLLMIARALSWEPRILVLDEPTTALAMDDVNNLFEIIRGLKEKNKSIVLVTHKLDEILNFTDRVLVLRDGEMVSGYQREKYDIFTIIKDMVGREITNIYPVRESNIGEELLRVENMTVEHSRIKGRNLIENISFTLNEGEVLGLVGLVGSGRTETLETIFGMNKLKTGCIYIRGKKVSIKSTKDAIQSGICLVTEDRKDKGLLKLANIRDNIIITNLKKICDGFVLSRRKGDKVADEYMQKLSIKAPNYYTMVVNLSGGNQQKVVISKTLNTSPAICLLDEPTKGIDVGSKNEIYHLINVMAESGLGVVMVSSELPEIMAMCDRFVILAQGKVVGELEKNEASQEVLMEKCFA